MQWNAFFALDSNDILDMRLRYVESTASNRLRLAEIRNYSKSSL